MPKYKSLFPKMMINGVDRHKDTLQVYPTSFNDDQEILLTLPEDNSIFLNDKGVDDLITVLTYWKENHG